MSDLLAARSQMAMSLAFHIIFAAVGMAMPLLMTVAEWRARKNPAALALAKRWSKGAAVLFAVGAVSGTVLSFELGLLWPRFMAFAGPIVGMPFSLEGFAFFLEAIFLGIYLYGWERVPRTAHLLCGTGVLLCGVMSALFVVSANAWMNTPAGFAGGNIDVLAAMFNPAAFSEGLHMVIGAFCAVGFAVAGVHAALYLRVPDALQKEAIVIALCVGGAAALVQPFSGDFAARVVAKTQPVKLAAMEGEWETQTHAPLRIGGWPDATREETIGAIAIPSMLSVLAYGRSDATVHGLKEVPLADRPPVWPVHIGFQLMVGLGTLLPLVALWGAFEFWRRRDFSRTFLRALVVASPLGFVAIEAGWVVTEVGRQPWIVQGVLRTRDAVTTVPHLILPFLLFTFLYLVLALSVFLLLRKIIWVPQ